LNQQLGIPGVVQAVGVVQAAVMVVVMEVISAGRVAVIPRLG
jgi:hypothetical protein